MNHRKIYAALIERARQRVPEGYVERHHIVPECMGGPDTKDNMVALYPEEHFLAHVLLVKIYPDQLGLINAVHRMCSGNGYMGRKRRKLYGWLKRKHAAYMRESQTGKGNSQFGSMWISDGQSNKKISKNESIPPGWFKGRTMKADFGKTMSQVQKGKIIPVKTRRKMAESRNKYIALVAALPTKQ